LLKGKEKELAKAATEKEKLVGQVHKLEASVEVWKGKEKDIRAQLDERMKEEESRDGSVSFGYPWVFLCGAQADGTV
jgi:hypothetical protein